RNRPPPRRATTNGCSWRSKTPARRRNAMRKLLTKLFATALLVAGTAAAAEPPATSPPPQKGGQDEKLLDLKEQLERLEARFGSQHPEVVEMRHRIEARQRLLNQQTADNEKAPPAKEKEAPAKSQLEVMLEIALKSNPDIHVAEAKAREADAELSRTRLA